MRIPLLYLQQHVVSAASDTDDLPQANSCGCHTQKAVAGAIIVITARALSQQRAVLQDPASTAMAQG